MGEVNTGDPIKARKDLYQGLLSDGYTVEMIGGEDDFVKNIAPRTSRLVFDQDQPFTLNGPRNNQIKEYVTKMNAFDEMGNGGNRLAQDVITNGKDIGNIGEYLNQVGADVSTFDRLRKDFNGLPEGTHIDYSGYEKLLKENEPSYVRSVSALQWQSKLKEAVFAKEGEGLGQEAFNRIMQLQQYGDSYSQRKSMTNQIVSDVYKYIDDEGERRKMIDLISQDRAATFGDNIAWSSKEDMTDNPDQAGNKYQVGALDYLKAFQPGKASVYEKLMAGDPSNLKGDALRAYEYNSRELEGIGLGLAMRSVGEDILTIQSKENPTESDVETYSLLLKKMDELELEVETQGDRYPETKFLDVKKMVQEAMGDSKNNIGERFLIGVGKGFHDIKDFAVTIGKKIFGSDQDLWEHELRQLGHSERVGAGETYVTSGNDFFRHQTVFDFSAIQDEIDAINESGASDSEKRDALQKLMYGRYKDIKTVENPDAGKINWTGRSMLEGVNSVVSQMIPMLTVSYLSGGGATASRIKQFSNLMMGSVVSTYEAHKVENLKNKIPNPEQRALVSALIEGASEGLNLDFAMFKKMFGSRNDFLGRLAQGVSKQDWDAAIKATSGGFKAKAIRALKSTGSNILGTVKEATTEELGSLANKAVGNIAFNEDNDFSEGLGDDFIMTAVGLGIPSLAGVPLKYRNTGIDVKYGIWELGNDASRFREMIKDKSPAEKDHFEKIITRSEQAINSVPPFKGNGNPFTDSQKAKYAYNEFVKLEMAAQEGRLPDALKTQIEGVMGEIDAENESILSGKDDEKIIEEASKKRFDDKPYNERIDAIINDEALTPEQQEVEMQKVMEEWSAAKENFENPVTSVGEIKKPRVRVSAQQLEEAQPVKDSAFDAELSVVNDESVPVPVREKKISPIKEAQGIQDIVDPRDRALQFFAGGGKINSSVISDLFGGKDDRIRIDASVSGERKKRIGMLSKDGGTIDDIAHSLWESDTTGMYSTQDYRNAVEEAIIGHVSASSMAKELVDRYITNGVERNMNNDEIAEMQSGQREQRLKILEGVPENQVEDLLKFVEKYEGQYGQVDWDRLREDFDGFDPEILNLPNETQNTLNDLIQRFDSEAAVQSTNVDHNSIGSQEKSGTDQEGEPDSSTDQGGEQSSPQRERFQSSELKAAAKNLSAAKKKLSQAEDRIAKENAAQSDLFGGSQQPGMFPVERVEAKSILDPLRNEVKRAQEVYDKFLAKENTEGQGELFSDGGLPYDVVNTDYQARPIDVSPVSKLSFEDLGVKEGDTMGEVVDKAIAYGGVLTPLFERIKADANFGKLKFVQAKDGLGTANGMYYPNGNEKGLTIEVANRGNVYYSLAHELNHFLTIDSDAAAKVKGTSAYKTLEDIYNFISFNKNKPLPGNATVKDYGLTNFKEFLAELLINPEFRQHISDVFAANSKEITKVSEYQKSFDLIQVIYDFFKGIVDTLTGKKLDGVKYDANKSAVDNAARIATELFFSDGKSDMKSMQVPEKGGTPLAYEDFTKQPTGNFSKSGRIKVSPIKGGKPKRLSQIIFDVSKEAKQRIFYVKPGRRRAAGSYSPGSTAVKIRYKNDLDVTAHELGHSIDDLFGLLSDMEHNPNSAVEMELRQLSGFGSKPPRGVANARKYILAEGMAEYIRALIVNPDTARSYFPNLTKLYETKVHADYKKAVDNFSNDVRIFEGLNGVDKALSNMEWDSKKEGWIEKMFKSSKSGEFGISFADRLKSDWTNPLHAFDKAVKYLRGVNGLDELLPADDPKVLARALMHVGGKMDSIFDKGMIDSRLKRLKDADGNVKNIKWLLASLDDTDSATLEREMKETAAYMIAERTGELAKRFGREDNLTGLGGGIKTDVEVANEILDEFNSYPVEKQERIKIAADRYRELADDTLRYMVDKGRLSQEVYDDIKKNNLHYVGMQRVLEVEAGQEVETVKKAGGNLSSNSNPIKKIKGSSATIGNVYSNLMDTMNKAIREADRNEVMASFRELATGTRGMYEGDPNRFADVATIVPSGTTGAITIFINGKAEHWLFQPDIAKAIKGTEKLSFDFKHWSWLTALPRLLRFTVTHFPVFAVRNISRDIQSRVIMSNNNSIRNAFGFTTFVGDSKHWDDVAIAGGLNSGYYFKDKVHYYGMMQSAIKEMAKKKSVTTILNPARIWNGYAKLLEKGETLNRVAEYRAAHAKAKREGMDDYNAMLYAGNQSAELIDFAMIGHKMKIINALIPFTNAAVQGLRSSIIKAQKNPVGFTFRLALFTVLPQVVLWNLNHSDDEEGEEYEDIPDYQRDMFWNLKIGANNWVSIPKPFELGLLGSGIDRVMSYHSGNKDAFDGYGWSVAKGFVPVDDAMAAGPFRPIVEVMANKDFFRDKSIIPDYEENLDIRLRNTQYASQMSKTISDVMGFEYNKQVGDTTEKRLWKIDPRYIDHIVKTTMSYYGNFAIKLSNIGSEDGRQFDKTDTGFLKGSPAFNSKSITELQEELARYNFSYKTPEVQEFKRLQKDYFAAKTDEEKDRSAKAWRQYAKMTIVDVIRKGEKNIKDELEKKEQNKSDVSKEDIKPSSLK